LAYNFYVMEIKTDEISYATYIPAFVNTHSHFSPGLCAGGKGNH